MAENSKTSTLDRRTLLALAAGGAIAAAGNARAPTLAAEAPLRLPILHLGERGK